MESELEFGTIRLWGDESEEVLILPSGSHGDRLTEEVGILLLSGSHGGRLMAPVPFITGPTRYQYQDAANMVPSVELIDAIMDKLYGQHCGKAVVACEHCGQWGARYCACRHCGAPVD